MNKRVIFIGGGASSLVNAVLLKKEEPSFDIFIIEKDKKLGKKLSATGGGKCNIAPLKDNPYVYNLDSIDLVTSLFKEYPLDKYLGLLEKAGIATKTIKDYGYYPIHESAPQVVKNLYHQINKLGIKVIYDEFVDYESSSNKVTVKLKEQTLETDYLIIATGGLNGDMSRIFNKHNVITTQIKPGLCPIKVKENVTKLFGCRFEAFITLLYKKNTVKQLYGEVLFKKDGLSGIPLLNISSSIARRKDEYKNDDFQISIGLPKDLDINIMGMSIEETLLTLFKEEYANYLMEKHHFDRKEIIDSSNQSKVLKVISDERFTFDSLYDFKDAQVTIGGVSLGEIDKKFSLRNDKNIFVVGEVLDVDGICGGYNLRFAITSGFKAIASILNRQKR